MSWIRFCCSRTLTSATCSYGYFIPVAAGAPQNCSTDMKAVITHWDSVMTHGTKAQQHDLLCASPFSFLDKKATDRLVISAIFGLQNVTHTVDAASALQLAPWSWQSTGPAEGAHQEFFDVRTPRLPPSVISLTSLRSQFCDTLEVKDGVSAGPKGYGLDYALQQWGAWQIQTNNASELLFSTS